MSIGASDDEGPIPIQVMNEYCCDTPLWERHVQTEGHDLPISDQLRADLHAFAERWAANVDPAVLDDRLDHLPRVAALVDRVRAVRRALQPGAAAAADAEDASMREIGEGLRRRLQAELGSRYVVTYHHG